MRATLPAGLRYMIMGSVLAHAVVVAVLVFTAAYNTHSQTPPHTVLITKLVRLGQERPKELLPRKDEPPPPPPPPPPAVAPAAPDKPAMPGPAPPPPAPKVEDKRLPSARDRISEMSRRNKALERLKERVEGTSDGSVDGEVSQAELQVIGDKYTTEVMHCLKAHYTFEGVDANKVAGLMAEVLVLIQADGKIVSQHIEKTSGNQAFDQTVERAVKRCGQVSPPPGAIRDMVRDDGILVEFQP